MPKHKDDPGKNSDLDRPKSVGVLPLALFGLVLIPAALWQRFVDWREVRKNCHSLRGE